MYPGTFAETAPDRPACIMPDAGEVVTYAQLEDRSNQGAQLFRALGLAVGDVIAIYMENHPRYLEICWAAQRSGLYYTCIASHLTAPEVAYVLQDCGARAFITSKSKSAVAQALAENFAHLHRFMVEEADAGYESWEEALGSQPTARIADETEGSDFLYSSGTTGKPKGVRIPLTGLALGEDNRFEHIAELMLPGRTEGDLLYSPAPLYHAAPLRFCMGTHRAGTGCVVPLKFEAEECLRLLEHHRCAESLWVPTMFVRLLKLPESVRERYDVSSMRAAIHGAAPCPVPVKQQMIDWFGPVFMEYYGATEANGLCIIDSHDWQERPGSVGQAVLGHVHILDDDDNEVPPGTEGSVYFGDGYDFSYHNDPEKTAAARSPQGWSTLGDAGHLDEAGYLYLTDRKAFTIITGGVNVYPREVEDRLVMHPAVLDAAVFGVPHEDLVEQVKAVVQLVDDRPADPALETELLAYCRETLSPVKCPRSIDFVERLPREANGKLYKRLLRDRYWGKHDTRIV